MNEFFLSSCKSEVIWVQIETRSEPYDCTESEEAEI